MSKAIGIYMRVSAEEKDPLENSSIANQKQYIKDYINKSVNLKKKNILEFQDDGYSGTNDKRPGFQKLLEEVKRGAIDTIIVKDLSRFSRDYILLGDYLENIFPFMKIHFISINDGYDSNQQRNGVDIDVQFKNLLYDLYAKDCSIKVKTIKNMHKRNGKYMSWAPPFGYKKNPADKYEILIDQESADVVKLIYKLYLEGNSMKKIAKKLTDLKIKTPGERKEELTNLNYKKQTILTGQYKQRIWSLSTISDILKDEFYIGTYVFNKKEKKSYKGNFIKKPRNSWSRISNHHDPIITQKIFDEVQRVIKIRRDKYFSGRNLRGSKAKRSSIQGITRCKKCHHALVLVNNTFSGRGKVLTFRCPICEVAKKDYVRLEVKSYEDKIYQDLQDKIGNAKLQKLRDSQVNDNNIWKDKLLHIEKQLELLITKKHNYYTDYKTGIKTREEFIKIKNNIELEKSNLMQEKKKCQQHLNELAKVQDRCNDMESTDKLNKELVDKYIDTIYIASSGEYEIIYKQ